MRIPALLTLLATTAALTLTATAAVSSPLHHSQQQRKPLCHGKRATIARGGGANFIVGTRHRDVIWAGGGADRVIGRGGNDLICGGPGRDMLDGAKGLDTIYGGAGRDWCVAWRHREHVRFHHQCEIHVTETHHSHPHKAVPARRAALGYAKTLPSKPGLVTGAMLREASSCVGGSFPCTGGVPTCTSRLISFAEQRDVQPTAVTSGGTIAVYESFQVPDALGNWTLAYQGPWTAYTISSPGNYFLPPQPQTFNVNYDFGFGNINAGVAVTWFSYSGDGGQTWSAPQYAIATQYIQSALAGGNFTADSGECSI